MASTVSLSGETNRPYVSTSSYEDEPVYALLTIDPTSQDASNSQRVPLNLAIIIDASGTMYNFQLSPQEREYWLSMALSRNEMERGEADDRDAVYWSGQTLLEMQSIVRRPMTLVVDAVKMLLHRLEPGDRISVTAFADHTYTLFSGLDWQTRPDYCYNALDDLLSQHYPFEIGTGTKMAESLHQAALHIDGAGDQIATDRIIIVSDGIVQDRRETFEAIEAVRATRDHAITTIGVGDEFDEEFLTRVADNSRGEYYYAADSMEIADHLMAEFTSMRSTALHDVFVSVTGIDGAVAQDIYMVSPTMNIFDEMDTGDGNLRAKVGDLSNDHPTMLLLQIAPSLLPTGEHALAHVDVSWRDIATARAARTTSFDLMQRYVDEPIMLQQRNTTVQEYVDRFKIYRYEREAQRLQERGDIAAAREKLGAATRELQRLGETDLAQDLEEQMAAMTAGVNDPSRIKRIKATTRKLGEKVVPTR